MVGRPAASERRRGRRRPAGGRRHSAVQGRGVGLDQARRRRGRPPSAAAEGKALPMGRPPGTAGRVEPVNGGIGVPDGHAFVSEHRRRGRFAHADGAGQAKTKRHAASTALRVASSTSGRCRTSARSPGRPDAAACQARRRWCSHALRPRSEAGCAQRGVDQVGDQARAGSASSGHAEVGLPVMPSEVVLTTVTASSSMLPACTHS
jgi:hypothetical protein